MSLTVNFKTREGTNRTRIFQNAQGVSVFGKATGALGLGEPFTHVRLEIEELPLFAEDRTNIFGDYNFYFTTPAVGSGTLTLKLTATYSVAGQDVVIVPIAFGDTKRVLPPPPPPPQGDIGAFASSVAGSFVTALVLVAGAYLLITQVILKKQDDRTS